MEPYCLIYPIAKFVTEYFDLVDTTSKKMDKLLHQSFNAAIDMLDSARYADGKNREALVTEARVEFYKALHVEQNENLMLALVGLSMCHALLGDMINAKKCHNRIGTIKLTKSEAFKACVKKIAKTVYPGLSIISLANDIIAGNNAPEKSRQHIFNQKKVECRQTSRKFIEQIESQLIE